MYKVITSLWSKPIASNKTPQLAESAVDEDNWVFVADTVIVSSTSKNNMTNSWIASPPLLKTDEPSTEMQHLNPLENLLIEHASMSVYEQIPSKTRNRRPRKLIDHKTLDEEDEDEDDDEEEVSTNQRGTSTTHPRITNTSLSASTTTMESSTSSLNAHHRHLHRLQQQRRKRSKLLITSKRTSKILLP